MALVIERILTSSVVPKKRFGQNFLVDEKVVADLVAAAEISDVDIVVEIGAGTGVLTKELAKRAGRVLAFEIDRELIPVLRLELLNYENVKIINQDFLKVSNQQFNHLTIQQFKLVGSIPYQITSPLIHKLLTLESAPALVVLLIQKEVAEKITAKPPKATYLSNIVKLLGEVEIVRTVPKESFWPVPEVDGSLIKLDCSRAPLARPLNLKGFQKFLHRGFQQPRKMLRSKFDSEVLKKAGINPTKRAQELEFEDWAQLFQIV